MEKGNAQVITIAELVRRGVSLSGASSIASGGSIPPPRIKRKPPDRKDGCTYRNPSPKVLKTLSHPTVLVGTLCLPPQGGNTTLRCSCFQFSDGSASVCCDILRFDAKVIGRNIRVCAWNFIPLQHSSGFLEIIRCEYGASFDRCSSLSSSYDTFILHDNSFMDDKKNSEGRYPVLGKIESVSPIWEVPCAVGSAGSRTGSTNVYGFLADLLTCQCKSCTSKDPLLAFQGEKGSHTFDSRLIVYFFGSASSWHPALIKLMGNVVQFSGLKKKMVFLGKEESHLMFITTDRACLHVPKTQKQSNGIQIGILGGERECPSYTGTVTGSYVQGMLIELDHNLLLLLTDKQLAVPHSLRVGAIVSVINAHFVIPRFQWMKSPILGACVKTTILLDSFSPLETGCHKRSNSQSLLGEFINSLVFTARLWALLTVTCFRRKFRGIISDREILGIKQKEGLAQVYAASRLPPGVSRHMPGGLTEFCRHGLCASDTGFELGHLKLVVPFSDFIKHCEDTWNKMLGDFGTDYANVTINNRSNEISCMERSYQQSMRKVLQNEKLPVVFLGRLEISTSSGRLQIVDATGSIDVLSPDIPPTLDFNRIYEVNDYAVTVEGFARKSDMNLIVAEPLTCWTILRNPPLEREADISIYLSFGNRGIKSLSSSCAAMELKGKPQAIESGNYQLLWLSHKFPFLSKFQGNQVIFGNSSMFAEALVLPWNLYICQNDGKRDQNLSCSGQENTSAEYFSAGKIPQSFKEKRCKHQHPNEAIFQNSSSVQNGRYAIHGSSSSASYKSLAEENSDNVCCTGKILCLAAGQGDDFYHIGVLQSIDSHPSVGSSFMPHLRKILLEFNPEIFYLYEILKVNCYYIIKQHESVKDENVRNVRRLHAIKSHLLSLSILSDDMLHKSYLSSMSTNSDLFRARVDVLSQDHLSQVPTRASIGGSADSGSDVYLYLPSEAVKLLAVDPESHTTCMKLPLLLEDTSSMHGCAWSVADTVLQSPALLLSDHQLPQGNLISLTGCVLAIHKRPLDAHCGLTSSYDVVEPLFFWRRSCFCVHISTNDKMVRIFCDLSRHVLPTGFGKGVIATFYRVLALSDQDDYKLISVSFITVRDATAINQHKYTRQDCPELNIEMQSVTPLLTSPTSLLGDIGQLIKHEAMQLRCRVVSAYLLVFERKSKPLWPESRTPSRSYAVDITLAGFIIEDGSLSCCCWANNERAAVLLRLSYSRKFWRRKSSRKDHPCSTKVARMERILKQHGKVVVQNFGSAFDSSCQDLLFSSSSDKVFDSSDENFLKYLILEACSSTFLSVSCNLMESDATKQIEEQLAEFQMSVLPLQNIWATEVCYIDPLAEAKRIIQGLL